MGWGGFLFGLALAWLVGELVSWHSGGIVFLAGLVGGIIHGLQQRLRRSETQLNTELQALRAQVAALTGQADPAQATPNAAPTPQPMDDAADTFPDFGETFPDTLPGTVTARAASDQPLEPPPATAEPRAATAATATLQQGYTPETDERSIEVTTSLGASLRAWFTGGNTIVRVAVLILFIGVAFLLRYAAERTTVPIELRLVGIIGMGMVLVVLGRRLLARRRGYALSLQGAGVGMVYLTLFAAYRLYGLIPPSMSFALLGLMAIITAVLAVSQNALPLAVLGFGGAFLAPVLTSTGQGSHVGLFSYCLLLNLAIAWIAQKQAWKLLNLVGFFFTFTLAAAWGAKAYRPEYFWTTEPFLIAHFLLYVFIAVQYTLQIVKTQDTSAVPVVDGGLLFGTPIVAFGLQAALLKEQPLALAVSAAVLSGVYLLIGRWLWHQAEQRVLLLVEGLLALGVIFLALVVPLALDARWTSASWAVQGAGVLWVGLRQRRWWAAGMGLLLQAGAAITFWSKVAVRDLSGPGSPDLWSNPAEPFTPFLNADFFGVLILASAALFSARLLQQHAQRGANEPPTEFTPMLALLQFVMMGAGLVQLWWLGCLDLLAGPRSPWDAATLVASWSAVLAVLLELGQTRLRWPELRWSTRALMLVALLASTHGLLNHVGSVNASWMRLAQGWGALEALTLTLLGLWLHRRQRGIEPHGGLATQGIVLAWYAMIQSSALLYTTGAYLVARHEGWTPTAAIILPTLIALWLMGRAALGRWPAAPSAAAYRSFVFQPWQLLLALWVLLVNAFSDARMAPLPYLPLLNPVDLGHGLVLIYCLRLSRWGAVDESVVAPRGDVRLALGIAAALTFWWLNSLLIRTLHHWAGTPMWLNGALNSALVQTGLTVLWTLSALVTMLYATRKAEAAHARRLWMVGAALLAVVVLKLFLVDLSNVGTLQQIVSFLAVGGLMLVIGYVSPMPPSEKGSKA